MKIHAIIVDDELDSRRLLEKRINLWVSNIEVVASCALPSEAKAKIDTLRPDLLFLDIRMPEMNGLEFFDYLRALNTPIECIFITAYDELEYYKHILKSGGVDCLVKPFIKEEFQAAVDKAVKILDAAKSVKHIEKITFNTATGILSIQQSDVLYIQASRKYSFLYMTNGNRELLMNNINSMASILQNTALVKIDRSRIVNLNYVQKTSRQMRKIYFTPGLSIQSLNISEPGAREVERLLNVNKFS